MRAVHATWNTRVPTGELNRWFEHALETLFGVTERLSEKAKTKLSR